MKWRVHRGTTDRRNRGPGPLRSRGAGALTLRWGRDRHRARGGGRGRRSGADRRGRRRRHLATHPRPRTDADPAQGRRTGRRASRGHRADPERRERQGDLRGPRRGVPLGCADPAGRVRGHPALRRDPPAGRQSRNRFRQGRLHRPAAGRRGRRDHPVQLPGAAGAAQAGTRAGRGQRGRPQARPDHPADRARAGAVLRGRRVAGGRAVGAHRTRRRAGRCAGQRPAGQQDLVHRVHRRRHPHHETGRGEEAVAGAGCLLPGRRAAGRRHRNGSCRRRCSAGSSTPARCASRCSG